MARSLRSEAAETPETPEKLANLVRMADEPILAGMAGRRLP